VAAITWADLVGKLPAAELADVALAVQTDILAFVHETLNVAALGGESSARLRRARMLLAAHLATITSGDGGSVTAGPVLSEKTSRIERTYANIISSSDSGFSGSSYGDEFARLIRTAPGARLPRVF
jgi:hypothetical protein